MATEDADAVTIGRVYKSDLKEINILRVKLDLGSQQETFRKVLRHYKRTNGRSGV